MNWLTKVPSIFRELRRTALVERRSVSFFNICGTTALRSKHEFGRKCAPCSGEIVNRTIRVLVVDDHQIVLWGLQRLIDGHKPRMEVVSTACDIDEVREKAAQFMPDVVVLSLELETENSLDIVVELRETMSSSRILIIAGGNNQAKLDEAILMGARGVVRKDESPEQVVQAIEKVMAGQFWLDREATRRLFEALMNKGPRASPVESRFDALTGKEKKVVEALMEDSTAPNKLLAERLSVSAHTLRHHLTSIYRKFGVGNRFALYLYITNDGECPSLVKRGRTEIRD
jgi:two-component system nitrate/nitrite response regulator NarL